MIAELTEELAMVTYPSKDHQVLVALLVLENAVTGGFSLDSIAKMLHISLSEVETTLRDLRRKGHVLLLEDSDGGVQRIVAAEFIPAPGRITAIMHAANVKRYWQSRAA